MSSADDSSPPKIHLKTPPGAANVAPPPSAAAPEAGGGGVSDVLRRWKREDLLKRGSLGLRGMALLFSLIAFIVMASNKHGDWRDFDRYEEYRYVLAIAILSTLYTGCQVFRQVQELSTGKSLLQPRTASLIDFCGDQIMAYFLISASSSAIPMTNRMRENVDNIFTDSSAAAISMSLLAFLCLSLSALVSGFKLSTRSYI
ncbi:CASP-like protein 4B1 [Senna tora]|uniref:CASP-like protein n=1 Tax=Senna tora TaxID=362788 RepID=A0A834XK00_9FABA|nr:CASP-like protein 4B1 [Senna tora]